MIKKLFSGLGAVALLSLPRVSPAADLTWPECVRLAAEHNPNLLSAGNASDASRALYRRSWNGVFPKANLSNSYNESSNSDLNGNPGPSFDYWTAQGQISLDLFDLGQWASIQAAAASWRQSEAARDVASNQTLQSLYNSFASLMYSQDEIQVETDIKAVADTNAQMIKLRYTSGTESKGNAMQTTAQLLQANAELAQASRDVRSAQAALAQSLGQDTYQTLAVTGTWSSADLPANPDFDALLNHHPQLRVQQALIEQAVANIRLAHSTLWPTLGLNYNRGWQAGHEFPTRFPYWNFSGTINYPLFANGPTYTYEASRAAEASYQRAKNDWLALRLQLQAALQSAWSSFAQAQDQVRVQQAFSAAAQQRKLEYDTLYRSGLVSFQEWQQVIADYINFKKSYLKAEQLVVNAEGQWVFAQGKTLGDSL